METLSSKSPTSDAAKRRRRSADDGRALVAAWQSSGLSMRAFASQRGVKTQRLSYWRLRLSKTAASQSDSGGAFIEVPQSTVPASRGVDCVVEWPDGMRLHVGIGADATALRGLVVALRGCRATPC